MLYSSFYVYFFFFFQAEDGIRDRNVTGVQTCALPIWDHELDRGGLLRGHLEEVRGPLDEGLELLCVQHGRMSRALAHELCDGLVQLQIGRASCRERVWVAEVGGAVERKRAGGCVCGAR